MEIDESSYSPGGSATFIGNRVLIQESDAADGWGTVAGVPFAASAVTGLSLDAATLSRNVVAIATLADACR